MASWARWSARAAVCTARNCSGPARALEPLRRVVAAVTIYTEQNAHSKKKRKKNMLHCQRLFFFFLPITSSSSLFLPLLLTCRRDGASSSSYIFSSSSKSLYMCIRLPPCCHQWESIFSSSSFSSPIVLVFYHYKLVDSSGKLVHISLHFPLSLSLDSFVVPGSFSVSRWPARNITI